MEWAPRIAAFRPSAEVTSWPGVAPRAETPTSTTDTTASLPGAIQPPATMSLITGLVSTYWMQPLMALTASAVQMILSPLAYLLN